ncbi:MAG: FAD:protein FMN transferase [Gammaproteobacteria bacterium]|nr:FAD:protein FMN transferase [Gammaproteobacteria bacterium]
MASPCDCLVETDNLQQAKSIIELVANEAWRIEQKYSRYQDNNICYAINNSNGSRVAIDPETFGLLQFAQQCYDISDGMFDLTSGVLRRVWSFKPNASFPSREKVEQLLPLIGWNKIKFDKDSLILQPEMEIDFGGIGKEYAVDKAAQLVIEQFPDISVLINFGGDLRVTHAPVKRPYWQVGVDSQLAQLEKSIRLSIGAICTSGDTERYLIHNGKRYGHILNPTTGYPIKNAPHTVTVIADHCLQAGLLATLAMLHGPKAESFLSDQSVKFYCQR